VLMDLTPQQVKIRRRKTDVIQCVREKKTITHAYHDKSAKSQPIQMKVSGNNAE